MHSDAYEPIWVKLGIVIDAAKVDILILIRVNLTLIQGRRDARKHQLSHTVLNGLDGIWYASLTCWSDEHLFVSSDSRERTLPRWFSRKQTNQPPVYTFNDRFFQTSQDDRHHCTMHLDNSVDDLVFSGMRIQKLPRSFSGKYLRRFW